MHASNGVVGEARREEEGRRGGEGRRREGEGEEGRGREGAYL